MANDHLSALILAAPYWLPRICGLILALAAICKAPRTALPEVLKALPGALKAACLRRK